MGSGHRKFDGFTTNAWRRKEGEEPVSGDIAQIQRNGVPLPIVEKTVDIQVPEKTSDLQNDAGFVKADSPAFTGTPNAPTAVAGTNTTQLATTAFVQTAITNELAAFDHLDYRIVDTLPTTGEDGVRYLVKHPTDANFEEWIYVNDEWHDIGSTSDVNLSNYYTKTETDALVEASDKIFIFDTANTPTFNEVKAIVDGGKKTIIVKHEGKFYAPYSYTCNEYAEEPELPVNVTILFTTDDNIRTALVYQNAKSEKDLPLTLAVTDRANVATKMISAYSPNGSVSARFEQNAYRLDLNNYTEGRLRHTFYNQAGLGKTVDVSLFPDYEVCVNDVGGNVVQIGTIKEGTNQKNLYQFYYRTGELPADAGTVVYNFTNLLTNYTINDFVDATGMTSNGIFIGNGRTDNNNRLIVQQFSKNSKNITIRTYQGYGNQTAILKIIFIGTKNS